MLIFTHPGVVAFLANGIDCLLKVIFNDLRLIAFLDAEGPNRSMPFLLINSCTQSGSRCSGLPAGLSQNMQIGVVAYCWFRMATAWIAIVNGKGDFYLLRSINDGLGNGLYDNRLDRVFSIGQ